MIPQNRWRALTAHWKDIDKPPVWVDNILRRFQILHVPTSQGGKMAQLKDLKVQWQTVSGDPVTVGDVTVTPQSQALIVRWPFGGFVWNRPVAILVEREGARIVERMRVVDVTRLVQLGLLGFSLVFSIAVLSRSVRRKEERL
jgi:hypothetical protein